MTDLAKTPPWLDAQVDQLIARMKETLSSYGVDPKRAFEGIDVVMVMLTEPPEGSSDLAIARWNKSCDHCKKYCPDGIFTGTLSRDISGKQVIVTFGLCPACRDKTLEES